MSTDLLGDVDLTCIVVELDRGCSRCGSAALVIAGPGAGPHAAALACPRCHRNGGWLPREAAAFVTEIVKKFGRPTSSIVVRNPPIERDAQRPIESQ